MAEPTAADLELDSEQELTKEQLAELSKEPEGGIYIGSRWLEEVEQHTMFSSPEDGAEGRMVVYVDELIKSIEGAKPHVRPKEGTGADLSYAEDGMRYALDCVIQLLGGEPGSIKEDQTSVRAKLRDPMEEALGGMKAKKIIRWTYGLQSEPMLTDADIAFKMDVSSDTVRRLRDDGLRKLLTHILPRQVTQ
jgi:hypothetical protein